MFGRVCSFLIVTAFISYYRCLYQRLPECASKAIKRSIDSISKHWTKILISMFLCRSGPYLMVHLWELYVAIRRVFGVYDSRLWTSVWPLPQQIQLSRYGPCLIWHVSRHLRVTLALSWRYVSWQKGCSLYQGEQLLFSDTVLPSSLPGIIGIPWSEKNFTGIRCNEKSFESLAALGSTWELNILWVISIVLREDEG